MAAFDVFLSHNSLDKSWVVQLKDDLTRYGLRVWLDKDEIRPGDLFAEALEEALENCSAIALIISPEAMDSGWVKEEYYRAVSLSKGKQLPLQMIPVILREAAVPGFVKSRNWIDFRNESKYSENVWRLVWGIIGHKPTEVLDLTAPINQPSIRQPDLQTQRYLDAAISRKVKVGQTTELVVLIRLPDSQGLRAFIIPDGDYQIQPEDVKSKEFPIEFPVDQRGKQLPLSLCIEMETIDFEVAERRKLIKLEPEKDTEPCIFLLTAKKRGPLKILVQVYLVQDELLLATGLLNVNGMTKIDEGVQNLRALISIPLGAFGIGTKKSLEPKLDVSEPGELHTQKRISAAKTDTLTLLRTEMADLRNDQQYAGLWPLLDFLEPLVSQPAYESDREIDTELRTILTQLQSELKRGADHRTRVGKMLGGFIQTDWTVNGDVQQAGRDVVINKIRQLKVVMQQSRDQDVAPKPIDPEALAAAEKRYRERLKKLLTAKSQPYVELSGDTIDHIETEVEPEFLELIPDERGPRRVKLKTLREGVDKYPCIVLLGNPGCGKTTALQRLACEFAEDPYHLPLPVSLNEFGPGMTVENLLTDAFGGSVNAGHWEVPELADNVQKFLEDGKLFCMFDALNEMPQKGYRERTTDLRRFIDKWSVKKNRFMVTCRVLDYGGELSGLQRIEVVPLNDEQIKEFLYNHLADDWEDLWHRLVEGEHAHRRLLEFARNPYLLKLMILVFKKEGRLGRSPADLLNRSTKAMLERAKRTCPPEKRVGVEVLKEALAQLAFDTQEREGSGAKIETVLAMAVMPQQVNIRPNWAPVPSPPERVLDLAASAHIIEMTGDRSSLLFYHQLLQEYFAACELLKRDPGTLTDFWRWPWLETEMPLWKRPEENYDPLPPPPQTNWEETTILAAGLMPENDNRLVQALLEVNPVLAGRCLHEGRAEVAPEIRQAVVDRLLATISDPEVALRVRIAAGEVLGHLGDPRLGELVSIPAGRFLMGDNEEEDDAKPQHEVVLPEYQIGKYPVTNAEFKEFVEAGGYTQKRWWTEAGWIAKERFDWIRPEDWDDAHFKKPNQPVVSVSWYECVAYCRWYTEVNGQIYRLPSEAEWEKAARGTDGRQYPWGNEFEAGRLNSGEGEQTVEATTLVGIYQTGMSPYGCLDMAGNVFEWTSTQHKDYKYNPGDGREDPDAGDDVLRVLRGGSWGGYQGFARCACRYGFNPEFRLVYYGFRVVVSPISAL